MSKILWMLSASFAAVITCRLCVPGTLLSEYPCISSKLELTSIYFYLGNCVVSGRTTDDHSIKCDPAKTYLLATE